MLDPIRKMIEVPCSQEHAFRVFVEKVETWWPLDKNSVSAMNGGVAKKVVMESREGGRVYEVGHDDQIHEWGSVTLYDPYNRFRMDWHIGLPAESASDVDVIFTALDDNRTRVELTHARWEAFGDKAESMRNGYDNGWVGVFEEAFQSACRNT